MMTNQIANNTTSLHNGVNMPLLGLGVYDAEQGEQTEKAVVTALRHGYRHVDTASYYKNEESVGRGVRQSGIPRSDVFVTTKAWTTEQGYDETLRAFEQSQQKLNLDYVDLYLIHWPVVEKYKDTWRAMERLYEEGQIKAIGVSNFHIHHVEDLMSKTNVKPIANQVELHPLLSQKELLRYCKQQNILPIAWSPLMRGQILDNPTLTAIARNHGKTSAQIILRWNIQLGIATIPKSVTPARIQSNADLFDFELSPEEIAQIDALNQNKRIGPDPDNFPF